jgi:hypothetical protein
MGSRDLDATRRRRDQRGDLGGDLETEAGVFDKFKKKEWIPAVVPELWGKGGRLRLTLRNVTCLADEEHGKRKVAYPDFGAELLEELRERHFRDFSATCAKLNDDGQSPIEVKLRDLPTIEVTVSGLEYTKREDFDADLAQALEEALESQQIKS